jgi:hypothetical protein
MPDVLVKEYVMKFVRKEWEAIPCFPVSESLMGFSLTVNVVI